MYTTPDIAGIVDTMSQIKKIYLLRHRQGDDSESIHRLIREELNADSIILSITENLVSTRVR